MSGHLNSTNQFHDVKGTNAFEIISKLIYIYIHIYSIMQTDAVWFASIRWQNKIFQLKSTTLLCVKPPLGFAEFMFARVPKKTEMLTY